MMTELTGSLPCAERPQLSGEADHAFLLDCACTANGHAATPPSSVMNSRLLS
jgi:hypothetical protein